LNGASSEAPEQPKSLREVAEAAYDEVERGADSDDGDDSGAEPVDADGVRRDKLGRFKSKDGEPGGAEDGEPPSPGVEQPEAPDAAKPAEPALGSTQPPQHWSEQDREMFARLPQEGQAFLLRRHTEMERDYTTKAQANATAVQFTDAVGQLFQDPVIAETQRRSGLDPYQMIHALLSMQRRGMNPDPRERMNLLVDVARNIGLDPAAIFATSQPGQAGAATALSEEDRKNPAIKYFADHLGRTSTEVQQLRSQIQQLVQGNEQAAQQQQLRVTKWGIDSFAEEKGQDGKPLHPHFDTVLPQIIELFRANPQRDLREAYETALWMAPDTRQAQLEAAERQRQAKAANVRASQANRSNVRGQTSRVTGKPASDPNKPKSLRDTIAETADEIGF
jgi:hypothetical protein